MALAGRRRCGAFKYLLLPALEKCALAPEGVRRDVYAEQLQTGDCNRKKKQIFGHGRKLLSRAN